jgi:N-methylhydantoinase A
MEVDMRLGIDVGGTFTDLVLIDDRAKTIHYTKTLTTPRNPADGVLVGIEKILSLAGAGMAGVDYIAHGTTIGTNALIERKGARVGLITTEGFRDVLEIARIERPDAGLYDINVDLPEPLVPRYLRLEVAERIGADGTVVRPLEAASARRAVEKLRAEGVEAIAICLLFSFRNPAHEHALAELCQALYPEAPVSLSCVIAPEFREFERTSTTVLNAYLLPVTRRYLESLAARLAEKYGRVDLRIMQTSGGAMTAEAGGQRAVNMVNSGPAGGALATALFGRLTGDDKVIGVDMGGTSFDIGLIVDGRPRVKAEGDFEGYPVKMPMIDVEGIGAGGGSLAWVDAGGALNVGPESAGAEPGPACYGRGGTRPAVTDANLVLGRLNPDYFLGAEMQLHVNAARQAIAEHVAGPLGLSVEAAAAGIVRVVNANMVRAISANSTQKGYDVREFSLLAFGGAGPLHAVELAQELGMRRVIVPPFCSVFSALGAVASDLRHDYVATVALSQEQATPAALQAAFSRLEAAARRQLAAEHVPPDRIVIEWRADLRYEGQSYELSVPVRKSGRQLSQADVAATISQFHELHWRIYAYGEPNEPVEFVSVRLAAIGKVPELQLPRRRAARGRPLPKAVRPVYFPAQDSFIAAKVYEREGLHPAQACRGPCLIEEATSTIVIPPGCVGSVDAYGNLVVEVGARRARPVPRRARAASNGRRPARQRRAAAPQG